jgi:hypothetical protein
MFLFNDPQDLSDLDLIHDRALPPGSSTGLPLFLTVGLGVGGFALTANPIVGGALAALPAYSLLKRLQKSWQDNAFERRNPGCIAHLIATDADMITWIEAHGAETVKTQLLTAVKGRQKLSGCAKRTLKLLCPDEALPAKRVDKFLAAGETSATEPVKITTQLGESSAIDVPSLAMLDDPTSESGSLIPEVTLPTSPSVTLLQTLIDNPYQCRAVLAGQRSGKTYSAAVATNHLGRSGTWIGYINVFDHNQGNAEAFDHAECVIGNIATMGNCQASLDLIDRAITLIATFFAKDDGILVVDEWMSLGAKSLKLPGVDEFWGEIANKATALSSQGVGSGKAIWGIAPFFRAESIREEAKSLKLFAPLVIAIAPGQVVHWTNPKTGKPTQITYDSRVTTHVQANWTRDISDPSSEQARSWKREECDRVFWWNGQWSPVGEMPAPKKRLERQSEADPRVQLEASWKASTLADFPDEDFRCEEVPTAIVLINEEPNTDKREALLIAYQWATTRTKDGKDINKPDFMNRARNERKCLYLLDNRDEIWEALQTLIN